MSTAANPSGTSRVRFFSRRRMLLVGVWLLVLYVVGISTGYLCIRYGFDNTEVGFADVALLRSREVRRGFAARQFSEAKDAWAAKRYQQAHLAFVSGLRNDPQNFEGRLAASRFLLEAGALPLALGVLEEGFQLRPDHRPMAEQLFGPLLSTGRDRRALELLRRAPANLPAAQLTFLRACEVRATLNTEGAAAARKLLERYPELEMDASSLSVVAKVRWESQERLQAIELLSRYLQGNPDDYAPYAELVGWYLSAGMVQQAEATAVTACANFPTQIVPRVLRIEVVAERSFHGRDWVQEIETFAADFRAHPEAIGHLALLAGRKGWLDLSRTLYEIGSTRQQDLRMLALAYSDALTVNSRFRESLDILAQIEAQTPDTTLAFMQELRNRQILCSAAIGDSTNVREFARRLVVSMRNDPERLEGSRRLFEKRRITAALSEFQSVGSSAKN